MTEQVRLVIRKPEQPGGLVELIEALALMVADLCVETSAEQGAAEESLAALVRKVD